MGVAHGGWCIVTLECKIKGFRAISIGGMQIGGLARSATFGSRFPAIAVS